MLLLSTTVNYIRTRFADLRAREDGVTAVEYALMVAIIALLMVAGFFLLFDNIQTAFNDTATCVDRSSRRRRSLSDGLGQVCHAGGAGPMSPPPAWLPTHVPRSTDL